MLVLSRRLDQKVLFRSKSSGWVGEVTVVALRGDNVRLGFEFPGDIELLRDELEPTQETEQVPASKN